MKLSILCAALVLAAMALPACGGSGTSPDTKFDPPNTTYAADLGIATPPPVSEEQAKAIAAAAAGGTAESVSTETEHGELFYEVIVATATGRMEVEVRASDGGVVEMEAADSD